MSAPGPRTLAAFGAALLTARSAPWRARSFLLTAVVALLGLGLWVRDSIHGAPVVAAESTTVNPVPAGSSEWNFHRPLPGATRICGSYAGAFLLGWALRRFLKLTLVLTSFILGLLALGHWAGWDTRTAKSQVQAGTSFVQRQAGAAKDLVLGFLPSATAAGAGGFMGFRRKDEPKPA